MRGAASPPPVPFGEVDTVRHRILRRIHGEPGITKTGLCEDLSIAWGTCTYHVEVLERTGRIQRAPVGRRVHLFAADVHAVWASGVAALRQPHARDVLRALGTRHATIKEVMDHCRLGRKLVTNRIHDLLEAGLVKTYGVGQRRYHVTDRANVLLGEAT